jgi:hypothetical protein
MEEVVCRRCGAVFSVDAGTRPCPHCGSEYHAGLAWIRSSTAKLALAFAFIGVLLLMESTHLGNLGFFAMVTLFLSWSILSETAGYGLHKPITALNLDTTKAKIAALGTTNVVPSPPEIPKEWEALISSPRPREVYLPLFAKLELLFEAIFFLCSDAFALWAIFGQRDLPDAWIKRWGSELFLLTWLTLWVVSGVSRLRNELRGSELLRDGEVAVGWITDWRSGKGGTTVEYRFGLERDRLLSGTARWYRAASNTSKSASFQSSILQRSRLRTSRYAA